MKNIPDKIFGFIEKVEIKLWWGLLKRNQDIKLLYYSPK